MIGIPGLRTLREFGYDGHSRLRALLKKDLGL